MEKLTFNFYGDEYYIVYNGTMWVSPCNGSQHSTIGGAIRSELKYTILASGDEVEDYKGEIEEAIEEVWAKL